jgi:hypothetical protein
MNYDLIKSISCHQFTILEMEQGLVRWPEPQIHQQKYLLQATKITNKDDKLDKRKLCYKFMKIALTT